MCNQLQQMRHGSNLMRDSVQNVYPCPCIITLTTEDNNNTHFSPSGKTFAIFSITIKYLSTASSSAASTSWSWFDFPLITLPIVSLSLSMCVRHVTRFIVKDFLSADSVVLQPFEHNHRHLLFGRSFCTPPSSLSVCYQSLSTCGCFLQSVPFIFVHFPKLFLTHGQINLAKSSLSRWLITQERLNSTTWWTTTIGSKESQQSKSKKNA